MSSLPTDAGKKAVEANRSILSPEEQKTVALLLANDQAHLFAHWPAPGQHDEDKHRFLQQCALIESAYLGGIATYVKRARELLAFAQRGGNPYEGYTVHEPTDSARIDSLDAFNHYEQLGMSAMPTAAFVIVAGGLGERLGYKGIKIALPSEIVTETSFIQLYIQFILALQDRARKATGDSRITLPLGIMTSDDTDALTKQLLRSHNNFGMTAQQLTVFKQGMVPSLQDSDAHFTLEEADKYALDTKPHGHGDVHMLLYQNGIVQRWVQQLGRKHIVFFQDTNGLVFRAIPAALGVSVEKQLEVNSLTVPRVQGDAVGAICKLVRDSSAHRKQDGEQLPDVLTINVEYNQLEGLLGKGAKEPLVPGTNFSKYPGNINVLVFDAVRYLAVLEEKKGAIAEFVNPKYNPDKRTFKKPTRLECFGEDTRVLTDRGFMSVAQLEAAASLPLFACYDRKNRQIVYGSGRLLYPREPEFEQSFAHFDANQDGRLQRDELKAAAASVGVSLPDGDELSSTYAQLSGGAAEGVPQAAYVKYLTDLTKYDKEKTQLISFTDKQEYCRWNDSSFDDGQGLNVGKEHGPDFWSSSHLSLRVTPGHYMFAQQGTNEVLNGVVTGSSWLLEKNNVRGYRRIEAAQLLTDVGHPWIRLLAHAQDGVRADAEHTVQEELGEALGVDDYKAVCAFLELYGFWLGDGSLVYSCHARQGSWRCKGVSFNQKKTADISWLIAKFGEAGLVKEVDWTTGSVSSDGGRTLIIVNPRWKAFFNSTYHRKYKRGPESLLSPAPLSAPSVNLIAAVNTSAVNVAVNAASPQKKVKTVSGAVLDVVDLTDVVEEDDTEADVDIGGETAESIKWFMDWVFVVPNKQELRLILEGLRRADGSWAGDKRIIFTSSASFRDQILRLVLHAGYAGFFYSECRESVINGYSSLDSADRRMYRPSEVVGREHLFRPIKATTHGYTVSYAEPDSCSGKQACWPTVTLGEMKTEDYTGRLWCVYVEHKDHLIIAQRFHVNPAGLVTMAAQPIIVGQCMMQEWPKLLSKDAKVGFSEFQRWTSFSAVKNALADGAAKQKSGNAPESAATGEADMYAWTQRVLHEAGVDIEEPDKRSFKGIEVPVGAKVVLSPSFGVTQREIHSKLPGKRNIHIHKDATLVLDGSAIVLKALDVHGTLIVKAADGAEVTVDGLTIKNAGWQLEEIKDDSAVDQKYAVRGYTLRKQAADVFVFDKPGRYVLSDQTKAQHQQHKQ